LTDTYSYKMGWFDKAMKQANRAVSAVVNPFELGDLDEIVARQVEFYLSLI
jgi:hypothetical protein